MQSLEHSPPLPEVAGRRGRGRAVVFAMRKSRNSEGHGPRCHGHHTVIMDDSDRSQANLKTRIDSHNTRADSAAAGHWRLPSLSFSGHDSAITEPVQRQPGTQDATSLIESCVSESQTRNRLQGRSG